MPRKITASKKSRTGAGSSSTETHFTDEVHILRHVCLSSRRFGRTQVIDWDTLIQLKIADRIREMISFSGWDRIFSLSHEVFRRPTLEVLSSFEADRSAVGEQNRTPITFQLFGRQRAMSYTQFALYMGLYDRDCTFAREYAELLTAFPEHTISSASFWIQLGGRHDSHKASFMTDPVHRYLHALISRTNAAHSDNCGVVIVTDRLFLYSLNERVLIHLGYMLADYLAHQGQNTRLTDIHARPYITRLIMGMGLEAELEGEQHLQLVSPLDMTLLAHIGLVRRAGGRYTFVGHTSDSSEEEGSDSDDSDAVDPSAQLPSALGGLSAPRSRYTRLEEQMTEMRAVQDMILAEQRRLGEQFSEHSLFIHGHTAFAPPPPPPPADDEPPRDT